MATPPAFAATGDLVAARTFSQNCNSGLNVGITFDGTSLWVSCRETSPDLLRIDPATGTVLASFSEAGGLGSLAYDSSLNVIWAAEGAGNFTGVVVKIPLDASKTVASPYVAGFPVPQANNGFNLVDGLAIDLAGVSPDPPAVLYVSYERSAFIFTYNADTGAFLGRFLEAPGIRALPCVDAFNSGVAIGGQLLYEGSDGCSHVFVVDKTTLAPQFDFTTVVAGDPNFRDESLTCDTKTFFSTLGKHVMWSKEAFNPNRAHAYEIPLNTCGSGGQPPPNNTNSCPLSQGYWKNHSQFWPAINVTSLTLGGRTYNADQLLAILRTPIRGDASLILADQLIAAKLNIANGSDPAPVSQALTDADTELAAVGPLPAQVRTDSPPGAAMTETAAMLDQYNNDLLTPNCEAKLPGTGPAQP